MIGLSALAACRDATPGESEPQWASSLARPHGCAKTKATKTKTALRQETYNLSDLKHDLYCGFVDSELGDSVSVS